jgi:uncharacterized protein with HEPN domain
MPRKGEADDLGDRDRLEHMLNAAQDAISYVSGLNRDDLDGNSMLQRALVQCVQVIGEAAARTTDAGRAKAPGLPWAKMVGMRHILVHAYYDIDVNAVWRVITEHLPALVLELETALKSWPTE